MKKITVPDIASAIEQMSLRLGWNKRPGIDSLRAAANRREYAALIKVGEDAIFRWQKGTREPGGASVVKVVYTAAMIGIQVRDYHYDKLSDFAKNLGFIIFFDLVDESLWKSELKISDMSWLYDIALGRTFGTSSPDRQKILDGVLKTFQTDIEKSIAELKTNIQNLVVVETSEEQTRADTVPRKVSPSPQTSVPQPKPQEHEVRSLSQEEYDQVSAYITLLLPLATRLSYDNSPSGIKSRQTLRQLHVGGKPGVFSLSTILNRLCNDRLAQD